MLVLTVPRGTQKPKIMLLHSKRIHQMKVVNLTTCLPYTLRCIKLKRLTKHYRIKFYSWQDNLSISIFKSKNSLKPCFPTYRYSYYYNLGFFHSMLPLKRAKIFKILYFKQNGKHK